jgi:predicted nucleic acid-binding protein
MTLYLVDTCVWRDFYEHRFSKSGNPIGKYANEFFMKILDRKDKVVFSEGLFRELYTGYSKEDADNMLNLFIACNILKRIDITISESIEAENLSKNRNIPFIDCLNAVQARNHDALLITRDTHYFTDLKDIVKAYRPEDII